MNQIEQKTKEFIEFLQSTDTFKAYNEAAAALQLNEVAQKLLEDVEERQQTLSVMQSQGLSIWKEQIAEFNNAVEKMHNNEICSEYVQAANKASALARKISNQLSDATGVVFKSGGCCGGGGCC